MRLCALLCVVLTESFHTPQNTARRRTLLRAETETKSPYEVLGVRTSAKPDEIRKAFREKAKSLHPDVVRTTSGCSDLAFSRKAFLISSGLADVRTPRTS